MVITFSTRFQTGHPRAGEKTYFVEKLLRGLPGYNTMPVQQLINLPVFKHTSCSMHQIEHGEPKYHTIRAGNRFKAGQKVSLRIWRGRPRASKQINIVEEDIEISKVYDIIITPHWYAPGQYLILHGANNNYAPHPNHELLALNDGLTLPDFYNWFPEKALPFTGQIICFNPIVDY